MLPAAQAVVELQDVDPYPGATFCPIKWGEGGYLPVRRAEKTVWFIIGKHKRSQVHAMGRVNRGTPVETLIERNWCFPSFCISGHSPLGGIARGDVRTI